MIAAIINISGIIFEIQRLLISRRWLSNGKVQRKQTKEEKRNERQEDEMKQTISTQFEAIYLRDRTINRQKCAHNQTS